MPWLIVATQGVFHFPPGPSCLPEPLRELKWVCSGGGLPAFTYSPVTISCADVCTPSALKATSPLSCGLRAESVRMWTGPCTARWHAGPG